MKVSLSKPADMGSGSIPQVILALAIPSMLSMFFQNLYAVIDTLFISWLGTVPLAAQALSIPVFYVALSLGKGVQFGAATLISHVRGRGELNEVKPLAQAALPMALLAITPLLLLLIPPISDWFFTLLGGRGEVLVHAYRYTFWLLLGFPIMVYVMICGFQPWDTFLYPLSWHYLPWLRDYRSPGSPCSPLACAYWYSVTL